MKPLDALGADEARRLAGVIFDLDDTVLDHGALTEAAYSALFRMREVGLRLIACTGRPAGWGEVIARQWPVEAAVVENGALALAREGPRVVAIGAKVASPIEAPRRERAELFALARELVERFPEAALASDNAARVTDVTIDIGEERRVGPDAVAAMRAIAAAHGVRTSASSVHLHLTFEADDKASGVLRLLGERFAEDPTFARRRWAFAGDSGNDAACFCAFETTFGVANVRAYLASLTVPPRFVAPSPMGQGFAEIAARLVALRRAP